MRPRPRKGSPLHGLHGYQGPTLGRYHDGIVAAPVLVHPKPVGAAARYGHARPKLPRTILRRACRRRIGAGASRARYCHLRRLLSRCGLGWTLLASLSVATLAWSRSRRIAA